MADQRRRGRGRSGRGGRIPRKGEQAQSAFGQEETFVSFPLDVPGPIRVGSAVDEQGVESALLETLRRERRQAAALRSLGETEAEDGLPDVRVQVERHRDVLEQLARDLGVETPARNGSEEAGADVWELLALQSQSRLGWRLLQRAAHASGDRRIDRVVRSVLREKERHGDVIEAFALRRAGSSLFRPLED